MLSFYSQFSQYYEAVFPFQEGAFSFLKNYITTEGAHVLDAGCGTGHYAGKISDTGVEAMGIDIDEQMIAYAKGHYQKTAFLHMDMSEIRKLDHNFDLIYAIGNVVSHLPEVRLIHFLDSVYALLSDRGYWIFQVVNWNFILGKSTYEFPEKKIENGALTFNRKYIDISKNGATFQTALKSEEEVVFDEETILYPMKSETYLSVHKKAGFKPVGQYGDYNGMPYEAGISKANIMVFQK